MSEYADVFDPSDDDDTPADITDLDHTEPVALDEADEVEAIDPPETWGTELTEEDTAERLDGIDVSPDPEDGEH